MSKKDQNKNMFGSLSAAAGQREKEQQKLEAAMTGNESIPDDTKRTTMMLSMTEDDKFKLKSYALKQRKSVSAIIHQWISENCE